MYILNDTEIFSLDLIERLHQQPHQFVIAITGGGTSATSALLAIPGASNTLLESIVPYSSTSLQQYLGFMPAQAVSQITARHMAMRAYLRARELEPDGSVIGLGSTAAITTNRDRKGDDRCFVAVQSDHRTAEFSLVLDKSNDRTIQEQHCQKLILSAMAHACGLEDTLEDALKGSSQDAELAKKNSHTKNQALGTQMRFANAPSQWQQLLVGATDSTHSGEALPQVLFPGAFNPLHDGHRKMVAYAEAKLGQQVTLEISTFNVDKPPLDYLDMQERVSWLQDHPHVFTNAPTFLDKSHLFPGAKFIVGYDTIVRIADPKYYSGSIIKRDAAIQSLVDNEHRFLVFGRSSGDKYLTLKHAELPAALMGLCDEVSESEFRSDISSSDIRAKSSTK